MTSFSFSLGLGVATPCHIPHPALGHMLLRGKQSSGAYTPCRGQAAIGAHVPLQGKAA